jgi:PBP1b-binding outer membrane lipoprotein LpoB
MTKPFIALILFCLFCLSTAPTTPAVGQNKTPEVPTAPGQTKPVLLTPQETNEALQAAGSVQALERELQQRWLDVLQAPLEKAIEVVAKAQLTYQRLQTAQSHLDRARERSATKHACPDCDFSADFKTLTLPKSSPMAQ